MRLDATPLVPRGLAIQVGGEQLDVHVGMLGVSGEQLDLHGNFIGRLVSSGFSDSLLPTPSMSLTILSGQ